MSRRTVARMESDNVRSVTVQTVRCVFAAAGAHARIVASWNGAALDRLLDERHAALVERVARVLQVRNWTTMVEQTFSEYGERGSIDLLGWHKPSRSLVVTEVKSALGNLEETNRSLDTKVRLAPRLLREKLGVPATVSRLLVLPSESTVRRMVAQHAAARSGPGCGARMDPWPAFGSCRRASTERRRDPSDHVPSRTLESQADRGTLIVATGPWCGGCPSGTRSRPPAEWSSGNRQRGITEPWRGASDDVRCRVIT